MSRQYLGPYVNFQGRAREAMEFYHRVLGGKIELQTVNEQGVPKPAGPGDRIMNARLEAEGALIIGSDGHPDYPPTVGDNMAIALGGTDKDRLAKIFQRPGRRWQDQDGAVLGRRRRLAHGQVRHQLDGRHR